jgi:hypothetical protein
MSAVANSQLVFPVIASIKKIGKKVPEAVADILGKGTPEATGDASKSWEKIIDLAEKWGLKNPRDIKNNSKAIERFGNFFENPTIKDAEIINKEFLSRGYEAPYLDGTKVFETIVSDKVPDLVRVHGPTNQAGDWVLRSDDIAGLTARDIANKFNLPRAPTHISKVELPAGTNLRIGSVGPNKFGNSSGAIQYEILRPEDVPPAESWFTLIGEIK